MVSAEVVCPRIQCRTDGYRVRRCSFLSQGSAVWRTLPPTRMSLCAFDGSFKCLCRIMWLSRAVIPSGVKQSWRAGKLSKNSFSLRLLAGRAFSVYLLASDQSSQICDKGKGCTIGLSRVLWCFATLLEQVFFVVVKSYCIVNCIITCVSGWRGTQEWNWYLSLFCRATHKGKKGTKYFLA